MCWSYYRLSTHSKIPIRSYYAPYKNTKNVLGISLRTPHRVVQCRMLSLRWQNSIITPKCGTIKQSIYCLVSHFKNTGKWKLRICNVVIKRAFKCNFVCVFVFKVISALANTYTRIRLRCVCTYKHNVIGSQTIRIFALHCERGIYLFLFLTFVSFWVIISVCPCLRARFQLGFQFVVNGFLLIVYADTHTCASGRFEMRN